MRAAAFIDMANGTYLHYPGEVKFQLICADVKILDYDRGTDGSSDGSTHGDNNGGTTNGNDGNYNVNECTPFYDQYGNYINPCYHHGQGALESIGEYLATVNWESVRAYLAMAWLYVALSFMGPWLFPPAAICLFLTNGNLDTCSLGIWSNDYTDRFTN